MIQSHTDYLLNTYSRPPILFTRGTGLTTFDSSNREYLDFTAGIAVTALGHADAGVNAIIAEQSGNISHASNVYWNEWAGELAKALIEGTRQHGGLGLGLGTDESPGHGEGRGGKIFFSNSGTEANEGALKFARIHGKGSTSGEASSSKTGIVCFSNAFHGRTMGALSVTPNPKYQAPFSPLVPDVRVGQLNEMNEETMRELVDETVCGVIVEPIQGEGGVQSCRIEWLEMLGRRCREVGAVLIYDEIQVGRRHQLTDKRHFKLIPSSAVYFDPERCGHTPPIHLMLSTLFSSARLSTSSESLSRRPDIVTMAKPLANGFPIGAIMVRDHIAQAISIGSHGTTFGGQPLATRIGTHVLSRLNEPAFISHLNDTASYLDKLLDRLPKLFPSLIKGPIRGRGLIRGIAFTDMTAPAELVRMARERGVLLLTAGKDTVRCVPALIVTKEQCDLAVGVMESCLHLMASEGSSEDPT